MISAYLRINKKEEAKLMEISTKLNMQRLEKKLPVLKESEILHMLIDYAFEHCDAENAELTEKEK